MSEPVRLSAVIHGSVQGVGFRWSVRTLAAKLGLSGYAANRHDGTVQVEAEGDPADLETLEEFLHRGPPGAEVTGVEIRRRPATGEFSRFGTK
jgi:acylphosphatase